MADKMDINEARLEDIASLPFMNEQRARLIVDHIQANGPLDRIEQVDDITGIGEKLSQLLTQHFEVGNGRGRNNRSDDNNDNRGGNHGGGNHGNGNRSSGSNSR